MKKYKIVYRTESGTSDAFFDARSPEEAEDQFKDRYGYNKTILGIYVKGWFPVG